MREEYENARNEWERLKELLDADAPAEKVKKAGARFLAAFRRLAA